MAADGAKARRREIGDRAYRRAYVPGASWFFTVNLAERKGNRLLVNRIDEWR